MNSRLLLKTQKNEVLSIIKRYGLEPGDFSWVESPSKENPHRIISKLMYKQTDFFFAFEMDGEVHYSVFSPANQSYIGSEYPVTWDRQKLCVSNWLINLIKEENEPDLWENYEMSSDKINDRQRSSTYVVAEPSDTSPGAAQMETRLNELLKKQSDVNDKVNPISIKRYYGKA